MKTSKLLFLLCLIPVSVALAHQEKTYDRNGGHYNDWGDYHCHLSGCEQADSRNSLRRRSSIMSRDSDKFFHEDDWPYWTTPAGTCKSMRTQVLEASSLNPVTYTNPRQCELREGLWVDEYTGEEYTRAAQLEVDHIIPPLYANGTNGFRWDNRTREQFSNDPMNLIPVSRATHRKKRDRSIGSWRPRAEFLCEYAINWRDIAAKYDLDLLARDTSRIRSILEDCGAGEISN